MEKIPQIDKNDIEFELLEDFELKAVESASNQLLEKIFSDKYSKKEPHPDKIWPDLDGYRPNKVKLVIKPLDRVGSEPGISGTRVLIGNFTAFKGKPRMSHTLVMKIQKPDQNTRKVKDEKDELVEEYKIATWIRKQKFEPHDEEAFAWPLDIYPADNHDQCSVLWSSFYSVTKPTDVASPGKANLTQKGLYSVLAGNMAMGWQKRVDDLSNNLNVMLNETYNTIERVFGCLKALHWHGNSSPTVTEKPQQIVEEYGKYLRRFKEEGEWGDTWRKNWGTEEEDKTKKNYNPVSILKRLESVRYHICVGAIHGDLHPRNIVFSYDGSSHIIDFGWASKEAHIAKDFALLECNLRFMMLRPDIPEKCLNALVEWIPFHNEFSKTCNKYVDGIARIIKKLHEIAKEHFLKINKSDFWLKEYIVPLFLISLGLLKPKVFSSCHNRIAAIRTVKNLASYIGKEMDAGKL